ncbi:cupin domain-containing protein [uncultured Propionivibrio sp.]|uniref:cupin domain-containing protein n=1 Tax=uncultured Propionivibrio sp. TaxID=426737 RepID=UPI0029C0C5B8|nr:cupin domain-containing protein [uncultured Propionivibrio sp.]
MKRAATLLLLATTLAASPLMAQTPAPQPILPESLRWFSPPNNPLVRGAWMLGAEQDAGAYVFRVTLARNAKLPVHTHPDTRHTTVLSGTLYVGFGDVFDESRMAAVPAGGLYVAPANVPHYLWAKDGDVSYQEVGVGPTATVPVAR